MEKLHVGFAQYVAQVSEGQISETESIQLVWIVGSSPFIFKRSKRARYTSATDEGDFKCL